ncbi:hypothetical protein D3C83_277070 [compost metagenome]
MPTYQHLHVRMTCEDRRQLQAAAEEEGTTEAAEVRRAVKAYLRWRRERVLSRAGGNSTRGES